MLRTWDGWVSIGMLVDEDEYEAAVAAGHDYLRYEGQPVPAPERVALSLVKVCALKPGAMPLRDRGLSSLLACTRRTSGIARPPTASRTTCCAMRPSPDARLTMSSPQMSTSYRTRRSRRRGCAVGSQS